MIINSQGILTFCRSSLNAFVKTSQVHFQVIYRMFSSRISADISAHIGSKRYPVKFYTYRIVLDKIQVSRPIYQYIGRYLKQCQCSIQIESLRQSSYNLVHRVLAKCEKKSKPIFPCLSHQLWCPEGRPLELDYLFYLIESTFFSHYYSKSAMSTVNTRSIPKHLTT